MTQTPKAVFFDLDETLIENKISVRDLFARMYLDFQEKLGEENQETFFTQLRTRAPLLWSSMFNSEISPEQQFIECFAQCVISTQTAIGDEANRLGKQMFEHYLDLSANNVVFHDGAIETLAKLREKGIITGLITNGMEQVQLGKVHKLSIQSLVDHVTVSAQARAHKPFAPVFELALKRAGVNAAHAVQVGDHPTNDVAGAIRAGLGGVFYNPKALKLEDSFAEVEERPTHHIHHLSQVLDLI